MHAVAPPPAATDCVQIVGLYDVLMRADSSPVVELNRAAAVAMHDGKLLGIDGPFAETREQLGGYFLIDANDLDPAISIAARIPMPRKGTVEGRPVIEISGLPMSRTRHGWNAV